MKLTIDLGDGVVDPRNIETAVKRSLMPFDKLNRLTAKSGSGKGKLPDTGGIRELRQELTKLMQKLVPVKSSFQQTVEEIGTLLKCMDYTPTKMELVQTGTTDLSRALLEMAPATRFAIAALGQLDQQTMFTAGIMDRLPISAAEASRGVIESFGGLDGAFQAYVAEPLQRFSREVFAALEPEAQSACSAVERAFAKMTGTVQTGFAESWSKVLASLSDGSTAAADLGSALEGSIKAAINNLIYAVNNAFIAPFSGVNAALSKLKSFKIGGLEPFKNLNFTFSAPQIPLLASGAVLPANKPFLAMVGDQKHGTNVEAPLETIRQAVAEVMENVVEAELAGHNATVRVLTQILEAVLGIRLDDGVIGAAAQRYAASQAIITGGF